MAQVIQRPSNKAANIVGAVGQAVSGVFDAYAKSAQLKQQQQLIDMKRKESELQLQQMQGQVQDMASVRFFSTLSTATQYGLLDAKETQATLDDIGAKSGLGLTGAPFLGLAKSAKSQVAPAYKEFGDALKQATAFALNPSIVKDQKAFDNMMTQQNSAYQKMSEIASVLPNEGKALQQLKGQIDGYMAKGLAAVQEREKLLQEHKNKLEELAASKEAKATELTPAQKGFETAAGSGLAKQGAELLPKLRESSKIVDKAISMVDKVSTGPLVGSDPGVWIQKITNTNAQYFDNLIKKGYIQKFMEFAKEAGVRSMDTPQEQNRIIDSLANWKQRPEVLKKVLREVKTAAQEAEARIKEKQAYLTSGKPMSEFVSKYDASEGPTSGVQSALSILK
jgi:hypothetical protein